ncbi:unnamed protein product, partial [Didymodactylos carnosus]
KEETDQEAMDIRQKCEDYVVSVNELESHILLVKTPIRRLSFYNRDISDDAISLGFVEIGIQLEPISSDITLKQDSRTVTNGGIIPALLDTSDEHIHCSQKITKHSPLIRCFSATSTLQSNCSGDYGNGLHYRSSPSLENCCERLKRKTSLNR